MGRTKLKIIMAGVLIAVVAGLFVWANRAKDDKATIRVEGFDLEYVISDRKLALEDFEALQLGSSMKEIDDTLGEPDAWIGCGMLRPVYFLEDGGAVTLHFQYPAVCDGLREVVLIEENDESCVIKEEGP